MKTDTEEDLVRTEAEIGEMQPQAKECLGLPGLQEARKASPLEALEGACLPTPEFQTPGLQNHGKINFCCFKAPGLWYFVNGSPRKPTQATKRVLWDSRDIGTLPISLPSVTGGAEHSVCGGVPGRPS